MAFRTKYDRQRVISNTGDPYINTYKNSLDDNGDVILVRSGKDNVYQKIQAERDSCDLKSILARLSADEIKKFDISNGGMFGDFTQAPKTVREMRERMIEADNFFKTLPLEIREEFGYSSDRFFTSIGTNYFNTVMEKYRPTDEVIADTVVKESEVVE